jgi:hypothetical protein
MAKRVDKALVDLVTTNRPERLGVIKTGRVKSYFAYELGQACRIIYKPIYEEGVIEFYRVCSHKEAFAP